jgi:AcrR family transcriptional regulator
VPRTILRLDQRRRQILDAGIQVFARNGYRNSGISQVVQRAGVARGTFYLHFESKQQLFLAVLDDFHDRVAETLEAPSADLQAAVRRWLGFFADHRDQTIVVLKEASSIDARFDHAYAELRASAVELLAAQVTSLQRASLARPDVDPKVAGHLLLGMLEALVTSYVLRDADADLDRLAREMTALAWTGLRSV